MNDIELHDNSLVDIVFNWAKAEVIFRLESNTGLRSLLFRNVSHLDLPRKLPWGESISVNSFAKLKEGVFHLEMQSGDLIVVSAKSFSIS